MRWLVGWSSAATGPSLTGPTAGEESRAVLPVGAQLLWNEPDPLWAVGDWRPDEVRVVQADPETRLAVFGVCGATDDQLRVGLFAARGGALRHLTAWPGSYTAVVQVGRRITVTGDLAGARPVFHTPWAGGTAYATAALPLADLVEASLDVGHLAALLACPDIPEALGAGTPYEGVRRIPPGHALVLRGGAGEIASFEPTASLAVAAPQLAPEQAVDGVRDALVEAVRARLAGPRHAPDPDGLDGLDPGPVPGMGPAERRAARGAPAPGIGADLSGGSASGTLALLAAGLPGQPGRLNGHGERLLAVTFNDRATNGGQAYRDAELERARAIADNPRLHHVVVAAGEEALPYADLSTGPLTDEPGPSLTTASRHRRGCWPAARTTSSDTAPARSSTPTPPASPTSSWTAAGAICCARSPRWPRRTAPPRSPSSSPSPSTAPPAGSPVRRTRPASPIRRAACWSGSSPTSRWPAGPWTPRWPRSPGAGRGPPRAGSRARRWLKYRFGSAMRRTARPPSAAPGERRARAALARQAADHRVFEQAAEVRNQRLHAPFLDNQVVLACRALPDTLRVQPGARAAVLRSVLAGAGVRDLPPGWGATSHVTHAAAERAGLRGAVGDLVQLFDTPLLADAGLVEARVVRKALRSAAEGAALPLDGLAELVSTELWLRRLVARRGTCWTGAGAPRQKAVAGGVVPRARLA